MRQGLLWIARAVLYYAAFEAFAPFAIMFGGGWPRISEGVAFAVAAASLHPHLRRRFANRSAKLS